MDITPTQQVSNKRSVLVFGGSFDPVHLGHVALVKHLVKRLQVQELRLIPTGLPCQKNGLQANAMHRIRMLELAFTDELTIPFVIDQQEINRAKQQIPSFTVDTLINLRSEFGNDVALILLIGADQFHNLTTWKNWQQVFQLAHIVVAGRPHHSLKLEDLPMELADRMQQANCQAEELKHFSFGKIWLEPELAWDISATQIREQLQQEGQTKQSISTIPSKVLDYIQAQHLYN